MQLVYFKEFDKTDLTKITKSPIGWTTTTSMTKVNDDLTSGIESTSGTPDRWPSWDSFRIRIPKKIVKCFGTTEHQRHLGPDSSSKENWNSAAKIYNPGPCFLAWTLNFTSGKMPSLLRATNQVLDRLKISQISSKMIFILWEYVIAKIIWLQQKINSQNSFHLNNSTYFNWTIFFQVTVSIWWFFEVWRLTSPLYDHTADISNPIP